MEVQEVKMKNGCEKLEQSEMACVDQTSFDAVHLNPDSSNDSGKENSTPKEGNCIKKSNCDDSLFNSLKPQSNDSSNMNDKEIVPSAIETVTETDCSRIDPIKSDIECNNTALNSVNNEKCLISEASQSDSTSKPEEKSQIGFGNQSNLVSKSSSEDPKRNIEEDQLDINSEMTDPIKSVEKDQLDISSEKTDPIESVEKDQMDISSDKTDPTKSVEKDQSDISSEKIDPIKSVEKVTDEDGDEFIITMNESDESDEEIPSRNQNAGNLKTILSSANTVPSKSLPSLTSNIAIPPLPPLRSTATSNTFSSKQQLLTMTSNMLSSKQQLPLVLSNSNPVNSNTVPLVNIFLPSTIKTNVLTSTSDNLNPKTFQKSLNKPNLGLQQTLQQNNTAVPQSSEEMLSLIRWEISNRISNHRPKYQQIQPDSELGPLAKFLFDLGNDLVRETVYNDLVRIQTYRKSAGKLSEKEAEDLSKLKDVQTELKDLVGPIKQILKRKCDCGFKTESTNVLYNHQSHPHVDYNNILCSICDGYETKHPAAFIFHMEAVHNMKGRIEEKEAMFPCNLCPYETNSKSKLTQHKFRCLKNFNLKTNLSQNSIIGMEVNFCLENILYKRKEPIRPKMPQVNMALTRQQTIAPKPRMQPMHATSVRPMTGGGQMVTFNNRATPKSNTFKSSNVMTNKINNLINQNNQLLSATKPTTGDVSGFEVCEICGGYVKDRKALRIHFYYAHRKEIPDRAQAPLYCATCFARFWTAQGLQKHLEVHKVANAAKCVVCGHKVPNVLMHMRIVHNKELGSFLSANKCIYCGLVCINSRGVENHMMGAHGIMIKTETLLAQANKANNQPKPEMSRGSMCVLCNLQFSRNVDLTRHCMKVHHTCMKCGMVVADKVSLDRHTCLKSGKGLRNCELCNEKGFHPAYHVKHIRDKHIKKCTIDIYRLPSHLIGSVNIADSDFNSFFKANNRIKQKVLKNDSIVIISEDEKTPKKKYLGVKRPSEEVEIIDSESDDNKEVVDKEDRIHPSIGKKKCVDELPAQDKDVQRISRRLSSTSNLEESKHNTEQDNKPADNDGQKDDRNGTKRPATDQGLGEPTAKILKKESDVTEKVLGSSDNDSTTDVLQNISENLNVKNDDSLKSVATN